MTLITDPLFYALGLSKGGFVGVGQMALPLLALNAPCPPKQDRRVKPAMTTNKMLASFRS